MNIQILNCAGSFRGALGRTVPRTVGEPRSTLLLAASSFAALHMVPSNSTCLFELVLHKPSRIRLLFSSTHSSLLSIYNSPSSSPLYTITLSSSSLTWPMTAFASCSFPAHGCFGSIYSPPTSRQLSSHTSACCQFSHFRNPLAWGPSWQPSPYHLSYKVALGSIPLASHNLFLQIRLSTAPVPYGSLRLLASHTQRLWAAFTFRSHITHCLL